MFIPRSFLLQPNRPWVPRSSVSDSVSKDDQQPVWALPAPMIWPSADFPRNTTAINSGFSHSLPSDVILNSAHITDPPTTREIPYGPISSAYDEPWNSLRIEMESQPESLSRRRHAANDLRMQINDFRMQILAPDRTPTTQAHKSIMSMDTGQVESGTRTNKSVMSMDTGRDEADDRESSHVP